jgi:hypothetical protein
MDGVVMTNPEKIPYSDEWWSGLAECLVEAWERGHRCEDGDCPVTASVEYRLHCCDIPGTVTFGFVDGCHAMPHDPAHDPTAYALGRQFREERNRP